MDTRNYIKPATLEEAFNIHNTRKTEFETEENVEILLQDVSNKKSISVRLQTNLDILV